MKQVTSAALTPQLSLFNLSLLGIENVDRYSQLIGLYDMCPKGVSRKFKTTSKPSIIHREFEYSYNKVSSKVSVEINPTLVHQETRIANPHYDSSNPDSQKTMPIEREVIMYPSELENRIEEALIYIASQGNCVDNRDGRIGIFFSMTQLRNTLSSFGSKLNFKQIRLGIELLRKCVVDIKIHSANEGILTFAGTRIDGLIINDKTKVANNNDLPNHGDFKCFCYLHPLAAYEVSIANHALHDLKLYSQVRGDIAKSIFRRLCCRYTYADPSLEYSIMLTDFLKTTDRGSVSPRKDWHEVHMALEQLRKLDVIGDWALHPVYCKENKRKIIDKKMSVFASDSFKKFMIKSNALSPKNRDIA